MGAFDHHAFYHPYRAHSDTNVQVEWLRMCKAVLCPLLADILHSNVRRVTTSTFKISLCSASLFAIILCYSSPGCPIAHAALSE